MSPNSSSHTPGSPGTWPRRRSTGSSVRWCTAVIEDATSVPELFEAPQHEYTKRLLDSMPQLFPKNGKGNGHAPSASGTHARSNGSEGAKMSAPTHFAADHAVRAPGPNE